MLGGVRAIANRGWAVWLVFDFVDVFSSDAHAVWTTGGPVPVDGYGTFKETTGLHDARSPARDEVAPRLMESDQYGTDLGPFQTFP